MTAISICRWITVVTGTKGREWRKSIYKNIGLINIPTRLWPPKRDLKWPYIDSAVWLFGAGAAVASYNP